MEVMEKVSSELTSSPIPILFVSFYEDDKNCISCGNEYSMTHFYDQKYCKKCLRRYIKDLTDNNTYLDVNIFFMNSECSEHEMDRNKELFLRNIRELCEICSTILCFKQIASKRTYNYNDFNDETEIKMIKNEEYCKFCEKLIYKQNSSNFRLKVCSDCYPISSGWIESTLNKKQIQILYLPWWCNYRNCIICHSVLKFVSDCQKYCAYCFVSYTGCRYCLTTNVIFGFSNKSQCKKCERILKIDLNICGNSDLDDFLYDTRFNVHNNLRVVEIVKSIDNDFNPMDIYQLINEKCKNVLSKSIIEWIPYSRITDMIKIAKGECSIIYKAKWLDGSMHKGKRKANESVVIKRYQDSKDIGKYFLNELKSNYYCYRFKHHVIRVYGFTQDPESKDYMLVMKYASGGDLHNYLQRNFTTITWKQKLSILWQISDGLATIHNANFIHRDFHSGNILFDLDNSSKKHLWQIGDLGLSQPANNTSSNNEICGVIPYIAPEIFKGTAFSKASDVYCIGVIMWELTTGCKPFDNVDHNHHLIYNVINGKRPEITKDTPECFSNLMKRCWNSNPEERPSIQEIRNTFGNWFYKNGNVEQFDQAEIKRIELINSNKLGPEFTEKSRSRVIYMSKTLRSLVSKISSSMITFDNKQRYTSKEYEFDINDDKLNNKRYITKEYEFDIDVQSLSSSNLNFQAIYASTTTLKKRNIEELNIETQDNENHKYIKN